jgi:hypothetical protein
MESRKFRDESGRMYQATNGESSIELGQEADEIDEYSVRPPRLGREWTLTTDDYSSQPVSGFPIPLKMS